MRPVLLAPAEVFQPRAVPALAQLVALLLLRGVL